MCVWGETRSNHVDVCRFAHRPYHPPPTHASPCLRWRTWRDTVCEQTCHRAGYRGNYLLLLTSSADVTGVGWVGVAVRGGSVGTQLRGEWKRIRRCFCLPYHLWPCLSEMTLTLTIYATETFQASLWEMKRGFLLTFTLSVFPSDSAFFCLIINAFSPCVCPWHLS